MDQRSATAPPERVKNIAFQSSQGIKGSKPLPHKRVQKISKEEHHKPNLIKPVTERPTTLSQDDIEQPYPAGGGTILPRDSDHGHGYSTSSYDGDEGTPLTSSSGTSSDKVNNPNQLLIGTAGFYDVHSSTSSTDSSPESQVRIKTVPHHSVTNSIVRSDSPMPAHYLHSSNPTNIHSQLTSQKRSLDRTARSAMTLGRKSLPGHYPPSSASDVSQMAVSRVNPDKDQDQVLPHQSEVPIPINPIFSVYDSSSNSRNSPLPTPDLFPKPLILDRHTQRSPASPANTPVDPAPLISIIPPTPLITSNSPDNARTGQDMQAGDFRSNTVLAHTGASTPEESMIIQAAESEPRSPTAEKGTMTDIEYDENEYEEGDSGMQTPPEISVPATPPGRYSLPVKKRSLDEFSFEELQVKIPDHHAQDQFDELASYSDSDAIAPARNHIARTLYEEYILSDPRSSSPKKGKPASRSHSHHASGSREHKLNPANLSPLPMSKGSFARIINDLEDMLNQALELAGRAVTDSNTALQQRDASIRSVRSLRESIMSDGESVLGNAIAESFQTANDQQGIDEAIDEKRPTTYTVLRKKLANDSTLAVYRDDGESTIDLKDDKDFKTQRKGRTSYSESDRRRQSVLTEQRTNESDMEQSRSRIPRPTRNSTLNSVRARGAHCTNSQARGLQVEPQANRQVKKLRVHQPPPGGTQLVIVREKGGWDWSLWKKRYAAGVSCSVIALIGFSVGCYGGETPVIKADLKITTSLVSLGNILFILGVAIPSLLFWPLSLLHGRKPYTLISIALTIPLQLPQALSLPPHTLPGGQRSMAPFVVCILVFRAVSGFVLGFACMNALGTLVDLFGPDTGACCRGGVVFNSSVPIEGQDQFHLVRGGEAGARIGIWLGVWAWMFFSFGGVGFLIGRLLMIYSSPAWGFWIVAIMATILLFLVWLVPEVRPPWKKKRVLTRRRTGWKGKGEDQHEDRGEIKMIISGASPKWWWEEVWAGAVLSFRMCRQLGFVVMVVYVGWISGEVATVFNLLTTLETERYRFGAVDTGLAILGLSVGALLSVPVQLSTFYLRNFRHRVHHRGHPETRHHYHEGQHPYRAVFFISVFLVPAASLGFTISATGPPTHFIAPAFFAGLVAFSGTLVIAECHLIVMENFDISNLPEPLLSSASGSTFHGGGNGGRPHGTQRPSSLVGSNDDFTTCHPAISAAFGIFQFVSLCAIAGAVGWSKVIGRSIGVRNGLGIFTGITFVLTIALAGVLWRWKEVRVLEVYADPDPEGQPAESGARIMEEVRVCKVSVFQKGRFTRWSEVNGMVYRGDEEGNAWRVREAG